MVDKSVEPDLGREPVTISEEATRRLQVPVDNRAAVQTVTVATLLRGLLTDNATATLEMVTTTTMKWRGEGAGEEGILEGADMTGTVLGGEGEGEAGSMDQHPVPLMVSCAIVWQQGTKTSPFCGTV